MCVEQKTDQIYNLDNIIIPENIVKITIS